MHKIKVLVVEDSKLFREIMVNGINKDPELEVIAIAADAYEAGAAMIKYRPDVMTLDIELPGMSGIEFLKRLLPQQSLPVVVVSAINSAVFDALAAGAIEFVNKPQDSTPATIEDFVCNELNAKIKIAATVKITVHKQFPSIPKQNQVIKNYGERIIAIGASTGGTEAIFGVISRFSYDIPGVVIVQHMPSGFTKMYADRLDKQCRVSVREAKTGDKIMQGQVLLAPGNKQMRVIKSGSEYIVECEPGEKVSGHSPSVDVLFDSIAKVAGDRTIAILLTGMGADGAKGLLDLRKKGAITIGQDEESSVIYGMPRVAYEMGAVKYQVGLDNIANKVYSILNAK